MTRIFPELAGVELTHSWFGFIAYTFDRLPHVGEREGMHYAMGYCGSGVVMSTWLGRKAALRLLGRRRGQKCVRRTGASDIAFLSWKAVVPAVRAGLVSGRGHAGALNPSHPCCLCACRDLRAKSYQPVGRAFASFCVHVGFPKPAWM